MGSHQRQVAFFFFFQQPKKGRSLNVWEGFLVTLLRLRRGYDERHLADLFCVSKTTISRTVMSYVNVLHRTIVPIFVKWPSQKEVRYFGAVMDKN